MCGHAHDDDIPGRFPPQYCKTDCVDDGAEERRWVMGVGLGGRGSGGDSDLLNEVVCTEAAGKMRITSQGGLYTSYAQGQRGWRDPAGSYTGGTKNTSPRRQRGG